MSGRNPSGSSARGATEIPHCLVARITRVDLDDGKRIVGDLTVDARLNMDSIRAVRLQRFDRRQSISSSRSVSHYRTRPR